MRRPYAPRPRRSIAVAAAVLGMTTLAACGNESVDGSGGGAGVSDSGTAYAQERVDSSSKATTAYPKIATIDTMPDLKGKTVWYIPIGSVPVLAATGEGMKDALSNLGASVETCDGKFQPTTISTCMDQAASEGADAVVTGYVDYSLIPAAFDKLVQQGIPVLVAGESPSGGKQSTAEMAFYDTSEQVASMQRLAMDAVIADSKGKAKVLYVRNVSSTILENAEKAGVDEIKKRCSGCVVETIDTGSSDSDLNKLPSAVSAALISNPDTDHVVSEVDTVLLKVLAGVQTAGFANKVKVISGNGNLDTLQRVKEGASQFAEVGTSSTYDGWSIANALLQQLNGDVPKATEPVIRLFTKDNVSDLDLTPDGYATIDWYGDDSYRDTFLSAWGVEG